MSGNEAFEMVSGTGWSRGLDNMLRSGLRRWFKTRTWWVQCLIWGGLVGGILSAIAFSPEKLGFPELLMLFTVFAALFPAVGVVIIMQDALVGEKREGTAAWVLSKPVTRQSFLLSKVIANSVGIFTTMVVVPCFIGYLIISLSQKSLLDPLGFLAAILVIFASHFYFVSLTLMLGTLFSGRGPVIGIPLAVLFLQQNLIGFLPFLRFIFPWTLMIPLGRDIPLVVSIIQHLPIQQEHLVILGSIVLQSILFIFIGLWRFNREEF
ncbi:MAG TPA: ABC transporter permease subunit [Anaerolineales bacterium]|nr:ABC transporter permease subunit [Anaerolineales bacterium]